VHYYLFCAFGLLVVVHVALHWSWVCAAAGRLVSAGPVAAGPVAAGKRRWYGIGFLTLTAVSLALFLLIARAQVSSSSSAYRGGHALGTHNARTAPTASTETTPR
jgi:hypothetical protein